MWSSFVLSFSGWELVEVFGAFGVVLGCIGEFISEFTKLPKTQEEKELWGKSSTLLLVISLAIELLGMGFAMRESHREIASLQRDTSVAKNDAEQARKEAAQSNERVANTESNNLVLKSKVMKMDLSTRPLWSVVAFVSFRYKTNDTTPTDFDLIAHRNYPVLILTGTNEYGPQLTLFSEVPYKHFPEDAYYGDGGVREEGPANYAIALKFDWHPYLFTNSLIELGWPTNAEQFSHYFSNFGISSPIPYKSEIIGGRIEVVYNWSIWEEFSIPHQWTGYRCGITNHPGNVRIPKSSDFSSGQVIKPRRIPPERKARIAASLRDAPKPRQVSIAYDTFGGDETRSYAEMLKETLKMAGYSLAESRAFTSVDGGDGHPTGLILNVKNLYSRSVYGPLYDAFFEAGIFSEVFQPQSLPENSLEIEVYGGP